jgi:hypothetical protein
MTVEHRFHTAGNHIAETTRGQGGLDQRDRHKLACGPGEDGLVRFLLTGASGAGKSSARQAIEADLAPTVECVELRHLGPVPAVPDVAWRQRMAECAVARAVRLDADARGDPEELLWRHAAFAEWMRRHAEDPTHVPEVLIDDGWQEMDWSRLSRLPWNVTVIDGSTLTVTEVGERVRHWIAAVRTGSTPVFGRSGE